MYHFYFVFTFSRITMLIVWVYNYERFSVTWFTGKNFQVPWRCMIFINEFANDDLRDWSIRSDVCSEKVYLARAMFRRLSSYYGMARMVWDARLISVPFVDALVHANEEFRRVDRCFERILQVGIDLFDFSAVIRIICYERSWKS